MADMATSYRRAFLAYLVLDSGCAQAFTRDISVSTAGRPLGKRVCGLDCGATGLDLGVSEGSTIIAEIAISPGCDLGSFDSCHRVGINECNKQ